MCSRYCCWASYSRCWFFSRSSLIFMKFSKSPRYASSRCECRWMMSVATAFRKFLSWDTTRMVDCQVWWRQQEGGLSIRAQGLVRHQPGGHLHPSLSLSPGASRHPLPAGRSPATKWPSHPACSLALREGKEALWSAGMRMAGLRFFNMGKASDQHRGGSDPAPGLGPTAQGTRTCGSARDVPPTPLWYLDPGAQQQRLAQTPHPRWATPQGDVPAPRSPPAVTGLPPAQAGSQGPPRRWEREGDCVGHGDTWITRPGHGAELR